MTGGGNYNTYFKYDLLGNLTNVTDHALNVTQIAYDNLGRFPALVAAAALLIDYILTVSVSVSSGVAQITSAYPQLFEYRVIISIVFVAFMQE